MKSDYDPLSFGFNDIPHYYGDYVRALFLGTAVLSAVAIPVFGDILPFGTFVQVGSALLLVLLAGLTNPHSKMLMLYDVIVSGVGVLLLESAAISFYSSNPFSLFASREVAAIALLFAFYFSIKTLRAMSLGKVGKAEKPWEFEELKDNQK
jgi:hypothetical protein